jgi:8-oxo-dGTP pyrophosphatase MutT (NUDIX family)
VSIAAFPRVYWSNWDVDVEFIPGAELPPESQGKIFAAIVFAFFGSNVVMADIVDRGVCVPSGHLLPGEAIDACAVRETIEETGAHLDPKRRQLIGCYRMERHETSGVAAGAGISYSACFVAEVTHFGLIPEGSESRGYFLLTPEDIADQYFMWDDLLAAAFDFACSERERLFPNGPDTELVKNQL